MLVEIYDALKEAGASEEKARAAATSLTGRSGRLDQVEADLGALRVDVATLRSDVESLKFDVATLKADVATLKTDVAVIRAELALMKWMHGITIGGIIALIIQAFFG
jgi:outer membrane murein-binding lipoprotein Lpp